ncbi:MAG TPA: hypothetical protein VMR59_01500 [Patescibacteria group bacterium]|nr:hypothetical protein [Patescibacteria group bacterium]
MRKFSSERLYKLTRAAVILITILCVLGWYQGNKLAESERLKSLDEGSKCDVVAINATIKKNVSLEEAQQAQKDAKNCYDLWPAIYNNQANELGKTDQILFDTFIFLPIFFFGGRLTYKYVFPKVKKE